MEQMTYDDSVDISYGLGILADGNKKYLIVGGVTHGTEGSPTDGISDRSYWVLDLDSLTFEPYDGSIPINEYQAGYSLKEDASAKYIGSNSKGKYFYSQTSKGENYLVDGVWTLFKQQPMDWVIYRPTGYFYDIAKVFKPYVDKGEMQLLKGYGKVRANVVDCPDFARFIVVHMCDKNVTYNVGGKETYTYEEMAKLCFDAAGKPLKIKWAPIWLFGILANLPKIKKAGKHDIILFSKWTLSHDLVGDTKVGEKSFAAYIKDYFGKGAN